MRVRILYVLIVLSAHFCCYTQNKPLIRIGWNTSFDTIYPDINTPPAVSNNMDSLTFYFRQKLSSWLSIRSQTQFTYMNQFKYLKDLNQLRLLTINQSLNLTFNLIRHEFSITIIPKLRLQNNLHQFSGRFYAGYVYRKSPVVLGFRYYQSFRVPDLDKTNHYLNIDFYLKIPRVEYVKIRNSFHFNLTTPSVNSDNPSFELNIKYRFEIAIDFNKTGLEEAFTDENEILNIDFPEE